MAALFLLDGRIERRNRIFRERKNTFQHLLCDKEVVERYRLSREGIFQLVDLIKDDINPIVQRSHPLDATIKTLITLRYLAKGDFYSEIADLHGVSRSSVCRSISSVVSAINKNLNNIKFQTSNEDIRRIKTNFFKIASIPNDIGAVDGTLIPIIATPGVEEPVYVCRKGDHAMNVQAVVDANLRFADVVAKWPWSTHDATIIQTCGLKRYLEDGSHGWLLDDSGYPNRNYLITPKPNPTTQQELSFNHAHSRTRIVVEEAFGLLKSRFRCIHKSGGCLLFPQTSLQRYLQCA